MGRPVHLGDDLFPPFTGFPRECLAFLRKLKRNNNRPWFQEHRGEYEEYVRFPMQCLIAALAERMVDDAPEIEFNPKKSIFRIYRDTRFSKNKDPYKTNIAASFTFRGKKGPTETPGLYVGIEPGEIFIGGGLYLPAGPQLKKIRNGIATRPEEFLEIVENPRFKRVFGGIEGEKLQRSPLGFGPDHAMIEYLRHKQFYIGRVLEDAACLKRSFAETVSRTFSDCMPLVRWLSNATS
jgi:uncharacterized protein (TIGR02453 family)